MKRGCNDEIIEAKVRRRVVQKLATYYIENLPIYSGFTLNMEALEEIPEDGVMTEVIIRVEDDEDDGGLVNGGGFFRQYGDHSSHATE